MGAYKRQIIITDPETGESTLAETNSQGGAALRNSQTNIGNTVIYNLPDAGGGLPATGTVLAIDANGHTTQKGALQANFGQAESVTVYADAILSVNTPAATIDQLARPIAFVQWGVAGQTHTATLDCTSPRGKLSMVAEWVQINICFEQAQWFPGLTTAGIASTTGATFHLEIALGQDPDFVHGTRFIPANNNTNVGVSGASSQILSGPGRVTSISAWDEGSGGDFLQLFDTNVAPVGGAVPVICWPLPATPAILSVNTGQDSDLTFQRGCWWAISSTPDSLTLVGGAHARVDAWVLR